MSTTTVDHTAILRQAAFDAIDAGLSIIPINHTTKRPLAELLPVGEKDDGTVGATWKPFSIAAPDPDYVAGWWSSRTPPLAFAVVCGKVSGQQQGARVHLDFDVDGFYERWLAAVGNLADGLPTIRTGGGGYQLVYISPIAGGNEALAWTPDDRPENKVGRIIAIETRGEGGYAVMPPSVHPERTLYETISGDPLNPPALSQAHADALLAAARALDEAPLTRQQIEQAKRAKPRARHNVNGDASVIDAYNAKHRIREVLLDRGYRPSANRLMLVRPLKDGLCGSVLIHEDANTSYHFSTNDPLNNGHQRDPFDVLCFYGHDGDVQNAVKAAAAELGMNGHAERQRQHEPANPIPKTPNSSWPGALEPAALYGLAGEIVAKIRPHTEADDAALLLQLLVGFGNVIGRHAHFVADAAEHYMNEYLILVGATAKGRKGTSWNQARLLLQSVDPEWAAERIGSGLSSGEGLIWQVRDAVVRRVAVKERGRHTGQYDDVIETEAVEDKRLLVVEGEFSNVLKVMKREGNTLSPVLRLAWDSGNLRALTKNSPAVATGAHISQIGHITRDELRREIDDVSGANGFGNRFLWACVQRSKCLPEGGNIQSVDFGEVQRRLGEAVRNGKDADLITRDPEARELWRTVYPELSEGLPGMAGAMMSRAESHVMRLACIYALLDCQRVVRLPHLEAALALWRYVDQSVRHIFGGNTGDPVADGILSALNALNAHSPKPVGMTRTEIYNHFNRHESSARIYNSLCKLLHEAQLRKEEETTDGRTAERWFLTTHPAH